jgi:hypothetical protein
MEKQILWLTVLFFWLTGNTIWREINCIAMNNTPKLTRTRAYYRESGEGNPHSPMIWLFNHLCNSLLGLSNRLCNSHPLFSLLIKQVTMCRRLAICQPHCQKGFILHSPAKHMHSGKRGGGVIKLLQYVVDYISLIDY